MALISGRFHDGSEPSSEAFLFAAIFHGPGTSDSVIILKGIPEGRLID